jgi:oxygen-independent coproporphyrinogen-3 oxidase
MNWHSTAHLERIHYKPAQIFAAGLRAHHIATTAYPIKHLITMRPYKVARVDVPKIIRRAWEEVSYLGLYVHVPFCEARCGYCEYCVLDPVTNSASEDIYFHLLMREFEIYRQAIATPDKRLIGFDIGGGTPALPNIKNIACVVEAARRNFILPPEVTISIETTPKIAARQPEKIRALYELGIHRISMGVQTVNPRLLEEFGRTSTSLAYNHAAVNNIRRAGFERFNIDVMYGFANQSRRNLEATLQHVISLNPEYITLYRMRYKGTRIASQAQNINLPEVAGQYALAKEMLLAAGYAGTRGKNTFSRLLGDVGTSDYLTERVIRGTPYLGLGLGAQSLSQKTLAYNSGAAEKRLEHYQRQVETGQLPIQDLYYLSREAAMGKMISVSFYFGEINLPGFSDKFGQTLEQIFPAEVEFVLREGLMEYFWADEGGKIPEPGAGNNGRGFVEQKKPATLRLTNAGVRQVNGVMALFYAGAVKEYLIGLDKENGLS